MLVFVRVSPNFGELESKSTEMHHNSSICGRIYPNRPNIGRFDTYLSKMGRVEQKELQGIFHGV